jgi:hypothetical protein
MTEERFPFEKSQWQAAQPERQREWYEALERTGTSSVRIRLQQVDASSNGSMSIGGVQSMTKGFAEEWLAWHDRRKDEKEREFRSNQIFWTRWAAFAASVAAAAGAVGWIITILRKG